MIIKLENVSYIYNSGTVEEVKAVSDVNLELGGDSFIAIIGSTGSGKSTLIQMLNGLLEPASGTITYDGTPIYKKGKLTREEKKALRTLRCRVGLVFQYPEYQLFEETVFKDVCYGPKNLDCSEEEQEARAKAALEAVGVAPSMYEKSPFEISGGEKRRVAIAGVLAMEPEVLILDEPTAGLDPLGKSQILQLLKKYQTERHMTVILVSHSMEEVAEYADRVIAMNRSEIILDGSTAEVFGNREKLEEIGLGVPEVCAFTQSIGLGDSLTVEEAAEKILKEYGLT